MEGATAICSRHGKVRLLSCLADLGNGEYRCCGGNVCKGEVPVVTLTTMPTTPNVPCSAHGKMRTVGHVTEIGPGLYQCRPESQCRGVVKPLVLCRAHQKFRLQEQLSLVEVTPEGAHFYECSPLAPCAQGGLKRPSPSVPSLPLKVSGAWEGVAAERVVCSIHGKLRLAHCMQQGSSGRWQCSPEEPCRVLSAPFPQRSVAPPSPAVVICAAHGRPRSLHYLSLGADGRHYCRPSDPCRALPLPAGPSAPTTVLCAVHGRMRSINHVQLGPSGDYCCQPGSQCKGFTNALPALH
eukprot:EG_transcript_18567